MSGTSISFDFSNNCKLTKNGLLPSYKVGKYSIYLPGFVGNFNVYIDGKKLDFYLLSRRSSRRAGTRYNSRGIDDDGNVSNFVETE